MAVLCVFFFISMKLLSRLFLYLNQKFPRSSDGSHLALQESPIGKSERMDIYCTTMDKKPVHSAPACGWHGFCVAGSFLGIHGKAA